MENSLFYKATEEFNSYEKHVNAPYIRRDIAFEKAEKIILTVSGLGFYDLFFNGEKITKGLLAPYISNPDDLVYFDEYDITDKAKENNCIGLILGNGMQNAPGGRVWDFDLARWRSHSERQSEAISLILIQWRQSPNVRPHRQYAFITAYSMRMKKRRHSKYSLT